MTDDLKERLWEIELSGCNPYVTCRDAAEYIIDLEARLAVAEERIRDLNAMNIDEMDVLDSVWKRRAEAAEAGEDALAECIRDFLHETGAYRPHERRAVSALAAYEARRTLK